jgi:hypothetical protein
MKNTNSIISAMGDALEYLTNDASVPARALRHTITNALREAIISEGHRISGPTDHRVAEDGEPVWVCNARLFIARAPN